MSTAKIDKDDVDGHCPPVTPKVLTDRERQILELIEGDGLTSKEVAFRLGIADATVRVLRSRARKKSAPG